MKLYSNFVIREFDFHDKRIVSIGKVAINPYNFLKTNLKYQNFDISDFEKFSENRIFVILSQKKTFFHVWEVKVVKNGDNRKSNIEIVKKPIENVFFHILVEKIGSKLAEIETDEKTFFIF